MSTAQFPTSITDQLFEVVSRLATNLTQEIDNAVEIIPVTSTAGFPEKGFVVIDNETIYYSSLGANSLICTGGRGFSGTAASHVSGAQVKAAIVAEHFNRFRAELIATQTKIGVSGSTYTTTIDYIANQGYSKGVEALNYLYGTSTLPAFPITPSSAPTANYQVANKKYIDDEVYEESTVVTTISSSATPTPARVSKHTLYIITALAEAATFGAPTGTPMQGDTLTIRIKDDGIARSLSWNAIYRDIYPKPITTTISKTLYIGYVYNSTDVKWDCIGAREEG